MKGANNMSAAYYHLYERKIKRKNDSEERVTEMIDVAYNAGLLTVGEYNDLVALIAKVYGKN